jgi:DNA-binding CsgD family transcriptional regulator
MTRTPIKLTKRELDMIQGLIDDKGNKDIAAEHGISDNTVKVYLSRLYAKVGVPNRASMATWGRAYAESERLIAARHRTLRSELRPDEPSAQEEPPTLQRATVPQYDVFLVMAQTIEFTPDQILEIIDILGNRGPVRARIRLPLPHGNYRKSLPALHHGESEPPHQRGS